MSDLNKNITIPKKVATKDDLDYSFLREKGLEYIEQFASNLWTDYNSHDPGVTILEMLSYAITDLGSRINMPIKNILATENNNPQKTDSQFYKATQILPSKSVTEQDYRKLFIDISGVKNCWLKPFDKTVFVDCKNDKLAYKAQMLKKKSGQFKMQGLNSIVVDFDTLNDDKFPTDDLKEKEYNRIKNEIATLYHNNRNLCEDLVEIAKVETHPISVCASIDVHPDADEERVHAKVIHAIDNYFSPSLRFYSLTEMFEKGYTSDEIFEGAILKNGFLDPKEVENARLRTEVRLSDIMQLIMEVDGVNIIKEITINNCNNPDEENDEWLILIDSGKKPVRCKDSAYSYYKGVLPLNINKKSVEDNIKILEAAEKKNQEKAADNMEINIPKGEYLNTGETTTIQNDFPETYGIGEVGLPSRAETKRKAQAKQLKAYLLFFDQILATYFAHLGKVKDQLSVDNVLKKTYFTQVVNDIKDFEKLAKKDENENKIILDSELLNDELLTDIGKNIARKNIILDHLIGRFAEKFSEYTFLMKQLYGSFASRAVVNAKEIFLWEYGETTDINNNILNKGISNWRGTAFNYFKQPPENLWNTENVAGVQKRVARLCGMKNFSRRNLSDSLAEVYDLIDSDNKKVYRWRIRDLNSEIILSSTENYVNRERAEDELYQSVVKIIETPQKVITEAFKYAVSDEQEIGNFEIQVSKTKKYSFDVINLKAAPKSTKRIIARQFTYYNSQKELEKALLAIIKFMTTDFTEEGMFIVEHILLRPNVTETDILLNQFMPICTDGCTSCEPIDPYSFRVTVILPGWTYRFSNPDFRKFLEELIRKEIPAHILARVCWVGYRENEEENNENDMVEFEKAFKQFLLAKTKSGQKQRSGKLRNLIKILSKLNSIYPSGRLIDCDDEEDSLEGKIILGSTNIGNL